MCFAITRRTPAAGPAKGHQNVIRFSLPIFEHAVEQLAQGAAVMPRGRAVLHQHLQGVLTHLIADDVSRELKGRRRMGQPTPELLARFVASTFVLVPDWWLESKSTLSPKEVDAIFRALVLPALAA